MIDNNTTAVKDSVIEDNHLEVASDIPEIDDNYDKDVDCNLGQVLLSLLQ